MGKNKRKPRNKLEDAKTIVEILTGIGNIVLIIHKLLKG